MLAYDPAQEALAPVGVGRLRNGWVESVGPLPLQRLDWLAYVILRSELQTRLQAVAEGRLSLPQLLSELP